MNKNLSFSGMLDFSEMDLTAPNKVVEEILSQLPAETQNIISGSIIEYSGHVASYKKTPPSVSTVEALGSMTTEKFVDIQESLGKCGEEEHKFECFLFTAGYTKYKYRIFFMKYGLAHYPVTFTLEESISRSIQGINSNYLITCNNRNEVEELILKILTSKKVIRVMQELIRIYQAKKNETPAEVEDTPI